MECGSAQIAPDPELGKRVTGAGTHMASRKANEEERFTALFHHLSLNLFEEAFFDLKKDAAAGVVGLT
jgi:hypothetical protein